MNKNAWRFCLSLVMLIAILTLSGCSNYNISNSGKSYKTFTIKKGVGRFSFEYSTLYEILNVDIKSRYTDMFLAGPETGEAQDTTTIHIAITESEDVQSDYQKSIEYLLTLTAKNPDFKILEHVPITIEGISGEKIVCYYKALRSPDMVMEGFKPVPTIARYLSFILGNSYWSLNIEGLEQLADSDGANYEHIIQTFKIFN
jgi:hypothetical protein